MLERIKRWFGGKAGEPPSAGGPAGPGKSMRILMVCSGNICRSPTAEGVLRAKLQRARIQGIEVDSAGTHGFHVSEPPDPRAVAAAAKRGYDLKKLRARPLLDSDLERFDLLLAMDDGHLLSLQKRLDDADMERAQLLMVYAGRERVAREVPDPYFGGPAGFERVLDLVEDACDGMVQRLMRERAMVRNG